MSIGAVVVAYESGGALTECLRSLESAGLEEIVIVDNGSTDGSVRRAVEQVPGAKVVRPARNLGFGGGVNAGSAELSSELLLVCNSDIEIGTSALVQLRGRLEADPTAGVVGPQLVDSSGKDRVSARSFPSVRRSWRQAAAGVLAPRSRASARHAEENRRKAGAGGEVDWVTGACFLVRRDAFDAVGGFDTAYFMYVEEVDLCWRIRRAGWTVLHEPEARVTHIGGVSAGRRPFAMVVAHHRSLWRFSKATTEGRERLLLPLVAVGIGLRAAAVMCRQAERALSHRLISGRAARRSTGQSGR